MLLSLLFHSDKKDNDGAPSPGAEDESAEVTQTDGRDCLQGSGDSRQSGLSPATGHGGCCPGPRGPRLSLHSQRAWPPGPPGQDGVPLGVGVPVGGPAGTGHVCCCRAVRPGLRGQAAWFPVPAEPLAGLGPPGLHALHCD